MANYHTFYGSWVNGMYRCRVEAEWSNVTESGFDLTVRTYLEVAEYYHDAGDNFSGRAHDGNSYGSWVAGSGSTTYYGPTSVLLATKSRYITRTHEQQYVTVYGQVKNTFLSGYEGPSTASGSVGCSPKSSYAVTYAANGGSSTPSSQTKWAGEDLTLRSAITRENASAGSYTVTLNHNYSGSTNGSLSAARTTSYTFSKWKATNGTQYSAGGTYSTDAATTMTAQWSSSTSTASVKLTMPTRSGYTFGGWYSEAGCTNKVGNGGASYTPSGNVTLYAKWTQNSWTVSYAANGGSSTPDSQTKYAGTALTLRSAISRASSTATITTTFSANGGSGTGATNNKLTSTKTTSYSFTKWKATNGTLYSAGGSYTTDAATTMTAQWSSSASYSAITLPTPTWAGHTFNGWHTAASGGTKVGDAGASYRPTADSTLYAQWKTVTHTVTLDPQGGNVSSTSLTKTYGTALTLPTPTRSGCTFLGWNTAAAGTGTHYGTGSGGYTYDSGDRTLYAQWIGVSISSFSVRRSNSSGTAEDDGTYARANASWSATCTGTSNVTKTLTVKYLSGSTETTAGSTSTPGAYAITVGSGSTFSTSAAYKFTATASVTWTYNGSSRTATATKTATLSKSFRLLDALAGGTGLAIGTIATLASTFEVALSTVFNNVNATIKAPNVDRDGTAPSENQYSRQFKFADADNDAVGYMDGYQLTTGETGVRFVAFAGPSGDAVYNAFRVGKLADGTNVYYMTDPAAFRIASNTAAVSDQSAQGVYISPGSGSTDFAIYANVTNGSSSDYGDRVGLWAKTNGIALYNSTDSSYDWDLTLPVSVENGGSGRSAVYKNTTVSSVIAAASGRTISSVTYAEWGKVAQLSVSVSGFAASTGSQSVGTVVEGKRPVYAVYATAVTSSNAPYATLAADGAMSVYWSSAPGTSTGYIVRFVYLLA